MNDSERARVRHDAPVREAAAVTEDHHIARERYEHFLGAIEDKSEIALLAAVQIPIICIRPRIERRAETGIDKDADQEHPAIDAGTLDIRLRVVGRANPGSRLTDDPVTLISFKGHSKYYFHPRALEL